MKGMIDFRAHSLCDRERWFGVECAAASRLGTEIIAAFTPCDAVSQERLCAGCRSSASITLRKPTGRIRSKMCRYYVNARRLIWQPHSAPRASSISRRCPASATACGALLLECYQETRLSGSCRQCAARLRGNLHRQSRSACLRPTTGGSSGAIGLNPIRAEPDTGR